MELGKMILSKVSLAQKSTLHVLSLIWILVKSLYLND